MPNSCLLNIECDILYLSLRPFFFALLVVKSGGGIDLKDCWFSPPGPAWRKSLRVADDTRSELSWGRASVCRLALRVCWAMRCFASFIFCRTCSPRMGGLGALSRSGSSWFLTAIEIPCFFLVRLIGKMRSIYK